MSRRDAPVPAVDGSAADGVSDLAAHVASDAGRGRPRLPIVLLAGLVTGTALGTPLAQLGVPTRGYLPDVVVAVGLAVAFVTLRARSWWRLIPRPMLVLGALQVGLSAASLGWSADRAGTVDATVAIVLATAGAYLAIGLVVTVGPAPAVAALRGLGVALVGVGSMMWVYLPGFAPQILSTVANAAATLAGYFARFGHPWYGPSNNLAALLVPLCLPIAVLAGRRRAPWLTALVVVVTGLFATLSRGGLVALIVSVAVFLVLFRRDRVPVVSRILVAFVVGIVAALAVIYIHPGVDRVLAANYGPATVAHTFSDRLCVPSDRTSQAATPSSSAPTCPPVAPSAGTTVPGRTILQGRLDDQDLSNGRDSLAREGLKLVSVIGLGAGYDVHVHNTFLQQLVDFGYVGGISMCLAMSGFVGWWFRQFARTGSVVALAIGCALLGQMVSFLIESSYEGSLLVRAIWVEWGLLVGVYLVTRQASDQRCAHAANE